MARIIATKVEFSDLRPGDLWSEKDATHWNRVMSGHVQGQCNIWPNSTVDLTADTCFRLTILHEGERDKHAIQKGFSPFAPPGTAEGEI